MKSYLYICSQCGYDTAAYESLTKCLNCRADRDKLRIIGTSEDADLTEKLRLARADIFIRDSRARVKV